MAFAPGDVVTLKSGGHAMTIVSVDDEDIDCLWVSDGGALFRQTIPAIALTTLEPAEIDESDEDGHQTEDDDEHDDEEADDEDDEDDDEEDEDERDEKRRRKR